MVEWEGLSVGVLALALYVNTLSHNFVYDDNRAILTNPDVHFSSSFVNVFRNDFWGTPLSSSNSHGSYRPLCTLSFRLNHWISGFQPLGYHLTNVLLHVLATILVLQTARLFLPGKAPVFAASLFAVHPIHVEAVAGIVGRADVLASVLFLISFLFYVEHLKARDSLFLSQYNTKKDILFKSKFYMKRIVHTRKLDERSVTVNENSLSLKHFYKLKDGGRGYFILFLVFAVFGMLSKEPSVTVIPLAICYDIILHLRSKRFPKLKPCVIASASASLIAFLTIVVTRICIMGVYIPTFSKADNPTAKEPSVITRTLTFLYLPVFNFFLLICPKWLSFDWSMESIPRIYSFFDQRFLFICIFYYVLYRTTRTALGLNFNQKHKNILKNLNCKVCNVYSIEEHHTSCKIINNNNLPQQCECCNSSNQPLSMGLTVIMCLAFIVLPFLPASNLFFYVGFVVAERVLYLPSVGFCMLVALGVHVLWSSHKTLATGGFILLLVVLGSRTLQRNADWKNDESLYRSATYINPAKAYGNLGSVLGSAGRHAEAEGALRTALKHRPNMADVHFNLGNLLSRQHKPEEAVTSYEMAIHFRPSLAVAHVNLGQELESLERYPEAEVVYRKCSLLDVSGLKDARNHEDARTACIKALSRLCASHACQPETKKLIKEKAKVASILHNHRPSDVPTPLDIGLHIRYSSTVTRNKTRISEAEDVLLRAIKEAPDDPVPYVNYGQLLAQSGRQLEAAPMFLKAAQLAPHQHTLVTSAAIALRHVGRLREAEGLYRQARDLRPMDSTSHSNLGAIFHLQGKYRQAASCYKEALRLSPGDHVTLTNLQKLRNIISRNKR